MVTLYYVEDLTMREIGGAVGVSETRVSQLLKLALRTLRGVVTLDEAA
jgi:DNA-directed RNA polymerase specialized sigma subunit